MAMRMPIPLEMREMLAEEPYMRTCICTISLNLTAHFDDRTPCEGRIEWNHSFTYKGKRINERWAILPMCKRHHSEQAQYRELIDYNMRRRVQQFDMLDAFKEKYPRSDLFKLPPN